MKSIPRLKLSDFFSFPRPKYILGTTYTLSLAFFESLIWYLIRKDHLHRCVVLCDEQGFRRAISEAGALRSATTSYMVATAPSEYAFHPKVWVMLSDDRLSLLVGSGNLTQSGFIENLELFDIVELSRDGKKGSRELAQDIGFFLIGLHEMWSGTVEGPKIVLNTLDEMITLVESIGESLPPSEDPTTRFLSSFGGGFGEQLLQQIPDCRALYVAAPYFGASVEGLSSLRKKLNPQEMRIFPAIDSSGSVNVSTQEVASIPNTSVGVLRLAEETGKFAHLKLYGLIDSNGDNWLFNGSVNCTLAALEARNVEAGVLRKVPSSVLLELFEEAKTPISASLGTTAYEHSDAKWFTCWAVNTVSNIELLASNDSLLLLPLKDVTLSIRSGSSKFCAEGQKTLSFSNGKAVLPWSIFSGAEHKKGGVWLLELTAISGLDQRVHGACFIDDLWALSANPEQRSALRAIETLISGGSLPEHHDLLSVYRLLDETLQVSTETKDMGGPGRKPGENAKEADGEEALPIWPPVPTASVNITSTLKNNKFYWFQNMLSILLKPSQGNIHPVSGFPEGEGAEEEFGETGGTTQPKSKAPEKALNQALACCESLDRRLSSMIVTAELSHRIWPISTAFLLTSLCVLKNSPPNQKNHDFLSVPDLVSQFMSMLFQHREQSSDYCTPLGSRYKQRIFPPVAEDLYFGFDIKLHPTLALQWLAAFCYVHALKSAGRFSLNSWLLFKTIMGDELEKLLDVEPSIKGIFDVSFWDPSVPVSWAMMLQSMSILRKLTWADHPGWQDLEVLSEPSCLLAGDSWLCSPHLLNHLGIIRRISKVKTMTFHSVNKYAEYCTCRGCSKIGIKNPSLNVLRDNLPAICDGCGTVLVPSMLHEAFFGSRDGSIS